MATTLTAHYSMQKPDVGFDADQWGYMLNNDLDKIDSELFDRVCKTTGGTPQEMTNVLLTAECPQIAAGGAAMWYNRVATISWVEWRIKSMLDLLIPVGTIVVWRGDFSNLPYAQGWYVCNGEHGTPNLMGRFILAAHPASNIQPGNQGGVVSSTPGAHVHYGGGATPSTSGLSFVTDAGVANFGSGSATPPYAAVVFMMKIQNWA